MRLLLGRVRDRLRGPRLFLPLTIGHVSDAPPCKIAQRRQRETRSEQTGTCLGHMVLSRHAVLPLLTDGPLTISLFFLMGIDIPGSGMTCRRSSPCARS